MGTDRYTHPATCHVCGTQFMALVNVAERAKVCTPRKHKCQREERDLANGRRQVIVCVDKCCRSQYREGMTGASLDTAIDPHKVLTDDEFDRAWVATKKLPPQCRAALRFIAMTGCRLAEALVVLVGDIEINNGPLSYAKIKTYKRRGKPPRRVFIDNRDNKDSRGYSKELAMWVKDKPADALLFCVARRTLQRALERVLEPIKPDRASLVHIFRHTRASLLERMGLRPSLIQQQMGWASISMLSRYAHSSEDEVAQAFAKGR